MALCCILGTRNLKWAGFSTSRTNRDFPTFIKAAPRSQGNSPVVSSSFKAQNTLAVHQRMNLKLLKFMVVYSDRRRVRSLLWNKMGRTSHWYCMFYGFIGHIDLSRLEHSLFDSYESFEFNVHFCSTGKVSRATMWFNYFFLYKIFWTDLISFFWGQYRYLNSLFTFKNQFNLQNKRNIFENPRCKFWNNLSLSLFVENHKNVWKLLNKKNITKEISPSFRSLANSIGILCKCRNFSSLLFYLFI